MFLKNLKHLMLYFSPTCLILKHLWFESKLYHFNLVKKDANEKCNFCQVSWTLLKPWHLNFLLDLELFGYSSTCLVTFHGRRENAIFLIIREVYLVLFVQSSCLNMVKYVIQLMTDTETNGFYSLKVLIQLRRRCCL